MEPSDAELTRLQALVELIQGRLESGLPGEELAALLAREYAEESSAPPPLPLAPPPPAPRGDVDRDGGLAATLRDAIELLQHPHTGVAGSLDRALEERAEADAKLHAAQCTLDTLERLGAAHEALLAVDAALEGGGGGTLGRLLRATDALDAATAAMRALGGPDGAPPPPSGSKVVQRLWEAHAHRAADLRSRAADALERAFAAAVAVAAAPAEVTVSAQPSRMAALWAAAERLGLATQCADALAVRLTDGFCTPALFRGDGSFGALSVELQEGPVAAAAPADADDATPLCSLPLVADGSSSLRPQLQLPQPAPARDAPAAAAVPPSLLVVARAVLQPCVTVATGARTTMAGGGGDAEEDALAAATAAATMTAAAAPFRRLAPFAGFLRQWVFGLPVASAGDGGAVTHAATAPPTMYAGHRAYARVGAQLWAAATSSLTALLDRVRPAAPPATACAAAVRRTLAAFTRFQRDLLPVALHAEREAAALLLVAAPTARPVHFDEADGDNQPPSLYGTPVASRRQVFASYVHSAEQAFAFEWRNRVLLQASQVIAEARGDLHHAPTHVWLRAAGRADVNELGLEAAPPGTTTGTGHSRAARAGNDAAGSSDNVYKTALLQLLHGDPSCGSSSRGVGGLQPLWAEVRLPTPSLAPPGSSSSHVTSGSKGGASDADSGVSGGPEFVVAQLLRAASQPSGDLYSLAASPPPSLVVSCIARDLAGVATGASGAAIAAAVAGLPRVAHALHAASRDALDMHGLLVGAGLDAPAPPPPPTVDAGRRLPSAAAAAAAAAAVPPRTVALFHNDCALLAHTAVVLSGALAALGPAVTGCMSPPGTLLVLPPAPPAVTAAAATPATTSGGGALAVDQQPDDTHDSDDSARVLLPATLVDLLPRLRARAVRVLVASVRLHRAELLACAPNLSCDSDELAALDDEEDEEEEEEEDAGAALDDCEEGGALDAPDEWGSEWGAGVADGSGSAGAGERGDGAGQGIAAARGSSGRVAGAGAGAGTGHRHRGVGSQRRLVAPFRGQAHALRQLARCWRPLLPPVVCSRLLGHLADACLARVVDDVLSLTHISERASRALARLMRLQRALLGGVVVAAAAAGEGGARGAAVRTAAAAEAPAAPRGRHPPPPPPASSLLLLDATVPHWRRHAAVAALLDLSLAAIAARVLRGDGFVGLLAAPEAARLVRALFQPSEPRAALLAAVEGGGGGRGW